MYYLSKNPVLPPSLLSLSPALSLFSQFLSFSLSLSLWSDTGQGSFGR